MIAYRLQDQKRDIATLLDPEQQFSFPMSGNDEDIRHGVSACETLADLAAYIATHAIQMTTPTIIRIEGPLSEDTPVDATAGEVLLLPTTAEAIENDDFFTLLDELIDLHWEQGLTCAELREIAAERI